MSKFYTSNFPIINLHKKASSRSEIVTQMIYGDTFSIIKKMKKWLRIKIKEDGYKGYILKRKFHSFIKPSHKISVLKAKVYKFPTGYKKKTVIPFGSKIKVTNFKTKFFKFSEGWIKRKDVKPITYKKKNPFEKINIFKGIKYKWGGKSFKGIDCSGLIQIFLNFNNKFCPRDVKDQIKYFKKNVKLENIKKNDIIFWKGHVALALSSKKLIHAYGPEKKTVIMNINRTIKRIERTANLNVISIKRI